MADIHCQHYPVSWTFRLEPLGSSLSLSESSTPATIDPTTSLGTRTYRGKALACTACKRRKIKCHRSSGLAHCLACVQAHLPLQLCTSETVQRIQPFEKWNNESYKNLFVDIRSNWTGEAKNVQLRHYPGGPTIAVTSREFVPDAKHQVHVSKLDARGWHTVATTAYGVYERVDIASYVKECVNFAVREGCRDKRTAAFFEIAKRFRDVNPLIARCLELFTALQLIRIGCKFAGDETLGMNPIDDPQSAWHMRTPVPRMIQNELCHQLELHMIELDKRSLEEVEAVMRRSGHSKWLIGTLATFLLLHTRELDTARNIHWNRYRDFFGFWIHPSRPAVLIETSVASCNSLLSAYHMSMTNTPTSLNWDVARNQNLVDNDERQISALKALQLYLTYLRNERLIGRNPGEAYEVGQPNSLTFTISSLMFVDKSKARAPSIC